MNDGRVDPKGDFYVGGFNEGDAPEKTAMYLLDGKTLAWTTLIDTYCTNTIAFDSARGVMYHSGNIKACKDIYVVRGYADGPESKVHRDDVWSTCAEIPDGATCDADGNLWCAEWGGACVKRHNAKTGAVDFVVRLPGVPHVTCLCFGDADLRTLYITTASCGDFASDAAREQAVKGRGAGGLFKVRIPDGLAGGKLENRFGVGEAAAAERGRFSVAEISTKARAVAEQVAESVQETVRSKRHFFAGALLVAAVAAVVVAAQRRRA